MDNQGHGRYLNGCTNYNSVSIEMCVNKDADLDKTYKNVLELTKNLMKRFKVDESRVCRHYDVSRKDCPHNFRANNWALWWQFKTQIKEPIEWPMNLDKNSEFGIKVTPKPVPNVTVTDVENVKEQEEKRKEYWSKVEKVKVDIDGKKTEIRGKFVDGNNYVAIRDIAELIGLKVDWDQNSQTVLLEK